MKVQEVMRSAVRSITPVTDLATAGRIMAEIEGGILPVVGAHDCVVGVVTDRDICLALAARDRKPSEVQAVQIMSSELFSCSPDHDVRSALRWMAACKVRRLVVVDAERKLLGLLALDDVVLHSRALATAGFDGPFHVDIAETLHQICDHPTLAVRA